MLLLPTLSIEIREELPSDIAAIREVNRLAFGQDQEANLVDTLRSNGATLLSLVATLDGQVVGHIMYSPATIGEASGTDATRAPVTGAGLAPMAVHPDHQRRGIGSKLIAAGTAKLKAGRCPFIIVLGHPNYYPRFGFTPASTFGIKCEWDVPPEAFMLLILDAQKMSGLSGLAKYRPEFSALDSGE